jgi:hypothetical protein
LERAYSQMYARSLNGLAPESFIVREPVEAARS